MTTSYAQPQDLLILHGRRPLPVILQTEAAECGLACLAMIATFHGFQTDLVSLRGRFSVSSQGLNLKQLMDMAGRLNFTARALQLDVDEVPDLQRPSVLHWDMNHFVVLKSVQRNRVVIHDPALGERAMYWDEFAKHFTGVALELTPTGDFEEGEDRKRLKLSHFWHRITGLKRSLVQIFVLSVLLQCFAIAMPFYMQTVVDDVVLRSDSDLLLVLALGFGLLVLLQTGTNWLRETVILHLSARLNIQMAANLFRHLIRLPMDYFQKRHMGDIVSRFGSLQQVRELLTTGLVTAFIDGLMAVVTLVAMLIYSPKLTLVVLVVVGLYALLRVLLYRPLRLLTEEHIAADARHDSNFMESVRAIQTIKLFQKEGDRQNLWQNRLAESMNAEIRIDRWNITYGTLNRLLFGLENIVVVYLAARAVMGNVLSLGMLYAFMNYKNQFIDRMDSLIATLIDFKMLGLHLERLADIAFTSPEPTQADQDLYHSEARLIKGHLEVRDLNFRYGETDEPVFSSVSFAINAGETVAIIGPSGCGKTTLLKCLMGLIQPSQGQVLVDGQPVSRIPDYRRQIAGVMQDDQLMTGSIADNIACFDPQVDMDRVIECARLAAIHDEILAMPMQYNTLVGDMGTSLSGGQKQRLILARALYKKPRMLFMDEATSHLDVGNESIVNDNIREMAITRILVAHRPETIRSADRVIDLAQLSRK